jgi:hypothetical protein
VDPGNPDYASYNGVLFNSDKTNLIQYPIGNAQTTYSIPSSVTNVGDDSFYDSASLTSVTIPSSVTNIGEAAFSESGLTSATVPSSVTIIGSNAFMCTSLSNISTDANNPDYTSEDGVLFSKDKTRLIQYPIGSTQTNYNISGNITSIDENAFNFCYNLKSITVDENNPNYTSKSGVLLSKDNTQLIQYPVGNTQQSYSIPGGVKNICMAAFSACISLTSITIPTGVTDIGYAAFDNCTGLTSISIPSSVTKIEAEAFYGCNSLTSIKIPGSVKSIGDEAFSYCSNLVSITILDSVTGIGDYAFYDCNYGLMIYGNEGSCAQDYALYNQISFSIIKLSFGTPIYSTTALTNKNVTVTIPVNGATVASVSHTFTANGSYIFTISDKADGKATKTVKVSNIDKTKPTINVSKGHRVTVTVSDTNLKSKSVKLNGKAISWPKNNIFTSKGSYSITASDKAGNISSASFSI